MSATLPEQDAEQVQVSSRDHGVCRRILTASIPIGVASVLWAAAALKGYQLVTLPPTPPQELPRWGMLALVEGEFLFGALLCFGFWHKAACRIGAVVFLAFAGVAAFKAMGHARSCGCFGPITLSPWITMTFDLAAAPLLWLSATRTTLAKPVSWRLPALVCFVVAVGGIGGIFMARGPVVQVVPGEPITAVDDAPIMNAGGTLILNPQEWIGKGFPLRSHIRSVADISSGTWHILFYHHDCGSCRGILASLIHTQTQSMVLVSLPPHAEADELASRLGVPVARLSATQTWFMQTPVMVTLDGGRVSEVIDEAKLTTHRWSTGGPSAR